MRPIFLPISIVMTSERSFESSFALHSAFHPVSFIDLSVWVNHSTFPMRKILEPIAFIDGEIRPNLFALTLLLITDKFTIVFSSVILDDWANLLRLLSQFLR